MGTREVDYLNQTNRWDILVNRVLNKQFDLTGWEYLLTFGGKLEVYGRGNERVMIDMDGQVVAKYEVKER